MDDGQRFSVKSHRPSTPKINLLKLPAMHKPKLSMQVGSNRIKTQAQGSAAINPFDYNTQPVNVKATAQSSFYDNTLMAAAVAAGEGNDVVGATPKIEPKLRMKVQHVRTRRTGSQGPIAGMHHRQAAAPYQPYQDPSTRETQHRR